MASTCRATSIDEAGRLVEDDDQAEDETWSQHDWHQWGWWNHGQHDWRQDRWTSRSGSTHGSMEMGSWAADHSDEAVAEASQFLPDFVLAWMLLQRSGLDHQEKGSLIANLKNEFTMARVKEILRLNWPDDELKRRDTNRGAALLATGLDEEDEVYTAMADDEDIHDALLTDENAEEYQALEAEGRLPGAAAAAQHLAPSPREAARDATEPPLLQWQPRANLEHETVYDLTGHGAKVPQVRGQTLDATIDQSSERTKPAAVNLVFMMESESAMATSTVETALASGKAIVDGGATSSVGSIQAVEKIRELAWNHFGTDPIEVLPDQAPSF